jgi:ABC-type Zn uptake system ZnuABC Zn-binding protein ZnuA
MKQEKVKAVLVAPWNDVKLAQRVAEEAGVKAYVMATSVGAVKGADNYFAAIDYNVKTLAEALK